MEQVNNFDSTESQIVYKLARMEAQLEALLTTVKDRFDEIQLKFDKHEKSTMSEIEKLDQRMDSMEKWKTEIIAKITAISIGIGVVWTLFSGLIKSTFGL